VSGEGVHSPFKAVFYGAVANVIAMLFLVFPYLIFSNIFFALGFMIFNAVIVIFIFSFYISVARGISFRRRFAEMALASLGVAVLAFLIGILARTLLHIEI
jgi:VIT1/CCC1 family predicted Fe2+/Mn2+ transporter